MPALADWEKDWHGNSQRNSRQKLFREMDSEIVAKAKALKMSFVYLTGQSLGANATLASSKSKSTECK